MGQPPRPAGHVHDARGRCQRKQLKSIQQVRQVAKALSDMTCEFGASKRLRECVAQGALLSDFDKMVLDVPPRPCMPIDALRQIAILLVRQNF